MLLVSKQEQNNWFYWFHFDSNWIFLHHVNAEQAEVLMIFKKLSSVLKLPVQPKTPSKRSCSPPDPKIQNKSDCSDSEAFSSFMYKLTYPVWGRHSESAFTVSDRCFGRDITVHPYFYSICATNGFKCAQKKTNMGKIYTCIIISKNNSDLRQTVETLGSKTKPLNEKWSPGETLNDSLSLQNSNKPVKTCCKDFWNSTKQILGDLFFWDQFLMARPKKCCGFQRSEGCWDSSPPWFWLRNPTSVW